MAKISNSPIHQLLACTSHFSISNQFRIPKTGTAQRQSKDSTEFYQFFDNLIVCGTWCIHPKQNSRILPYFAKPNRSHSNGYALLTVIKAESPDARQDSLPLPSGTLRERYRLLAVGVSKEDAPNEVGRAIAEWYCS
ncbi:MAG: hypothetical protein KME30_21160 [Iphinoe sp. HA4291-MV1]|jgi:hypothetical protein|nr:hypothetical protein [Iphinoe sp. HA4291-MV1]